MNEGVIPGRYAMALYKYAVDNKAAATLYRQAKSVEEAFVSHPELQAALENPVLKPAEKEAMLASVVKSGKGDYFANFIKLVLQKRREVFVREIFLKYQQIYRKKNNIAQVVVITAVRLPEEITDKIKSLVLKKAGQEVEFVYRYDKSIIGGFILKVDSMQFDASVARELKDLRFKLLKSDKTV